MKLEAVEAELVDRVGLGAIRERLEADERLSADDGVALYEHPNLAAVGALAHAARLARHGRETTYNVNLHLDYTNVCKYACKFCAFAAKDGEDRAFLLEPADIEERLAQHRGSALSEVHMVAGIDPKLPYDYYLEILRAAKRGLPGVHVKAFTMIEIDHILSIAGKGEDEVFAELRDAGLDSCPGGGAEVLSDRVHQAVFREKLKPAEWLETARKTHEHGIRTNATMLYGHVERVEERVAHLVALRELQDETEGFGTFIPLAFWPYNTALSRYGKVTTGWGDLRQIAIARLMLDNFARIKAYWVMLTPRVAQTALAFGADDLDGTVTEERITHDAGTSAPQALGRAELERLISSAGFTPKLRT